MINRLMWLLWVIFYGFSMACISLVMALFWVATNKDYTEDIDKWFKSIEPKV